jgi:hypothetical protein
MQSWGPETEGIGQLNLMSLNLDLVPVSDLSLLPRTLTKLRCQILT